MTGIDVDALDGELFGEKVLGPVFAEFAVSLWAYLEFVGNEDDSAVLFCARGGMRLRVLYESVLKALNLHSKVRYADVDVSRIVAARVALLAGSATAYEEIEREFRGQRMLDAVRALASSHPEDIAEKVVANPDTPFSVGELKGLMVGNTFEGRLFRGQLELQTKYFETHLVEVSGNARRILLCDTGLYGSTGRMLAAGMPGREWTSLLFARSAYKNFGTAHFDRVVGLCVEAPRYSPFNRRSCALRYWHLIESVLEPRLPSVIYFTCHIRKEHSGRSVSSNLRIGDWHQALEPARHETVFRGVVKYARMLDRDRMADDAEIAWRELKKAIIFPSNDIARLLNVGDREKNFGLQGKVQTIPAGVGQSWVGKLRGIRASLWKEGYLANTFGPFAWAFQIVIEVSYIGRFALRLFR